MQQTKVFATVGHGAKSPIPQHGAAIWVEDVSTGGFTVCILKFGEGSNETTEANWIAIPSATPGTYVGTASFSSWTTGMNCKTVYFLQVRFLKIYQCKCSEILRSASCFSLVCPSVHTFSANVLKCCKTHLVFPWFALSCTLTGVLLRPLKTDLYTVFQDYMPSCYSTLLRAKRNYCSTTIRPKHWNTNCRQLGHSFFCFGD